VSKFPNRILKHFSPLLSFRVQQTACAALPQRSPNDVVINIYIPCGSERESPDEGLQVLDGQLGGQIGAPSRSKIIESRGPALKIVYRLAVFYCAPHLQTTKWIDWTLINWTQWILAGWRIESILISVKYVAASCQVACLSCIRCVYCVVSVEVHFNLPLGCMDFPGVSQFSTNIAKRFWEFGSYILCVPCT
jgi:hypothetical protein